MQPDEEDGPVARRCWLYKNNSTQEGPAGYWEDWLADVFDKDRETQWGGDYSTRSMEVHNYLESDVRADDVVAAYQTDAKAVVGFCVTTRMTGKATGQVDVQKPEGRMVWLRPIERLGKPLLVHRVKNGTPLEQAPAVKGPVMLRELTGPEMTALVALSGAPKRVLDGNHPAAATTPDSSAAGVTSPTQYRFSHPSPACRSIRFLRLTEVHMPASIKRIRDSWSVKPTAKDKGLTLTIRVTAYDNGMVEVDGIPINVEPAYDQGHGWLGAAEVITATLNEFRKDAVARRRARAAKG